MSLKVLEKLVAEKGPQWIGAAMTTEQRKRVISALSEHCKALERAERYSPEFRDVSLIESYKRNIAKLEKALAENNTPAME